ncbi:hypothetical protein DLAC_09018 [Tieghemostelium lacteum]|uniref:ILEI/PANDER domain-containing protein n=1 Tax=Tieghemostelium lacteum TaxID=361077 RepID=A0A151Z8W7_TIELA|nr:hypothetical protein DLAC_09018 [Tieghemostelium lacteum]|eukprot:KYQ90400.1 hypothetical protein DLAC_09018 [Tieghemostelium lacteum]
MNRNTIKISIKNNSPRFYYNGRTENWVVKSHSINLWLECKTTSSFQIPFHLFHFDIKNEKEIDKFSKVIESIKYGKNVAIYIHGNLSYSPLGKDSHFYRAMETLGCTKIMDFIDLPDKHKTFRLLSIKGSIIGNASELINENDTSLEKEMVHLEKYIEKRSLNVLINELGPSLVVDPKPDTSKKPMEEKLKFQNGLNICVYNRQLKFLAMLPIEYLYSIDKSCIIVVVSNGHSHGNLSYQVLQYLETELGSKYIREYHQNPFSKWFLISQFGQPNAYCEQISNSYCYGKYVQYYQVASGEPIQGNYCCTGSSEMEFNRNHTYSILNGILQSVPSNSMGFSLIEVSDDIYRQFKNSFYDFTDSSELKRLIDDIDLIPKYRHVLISSTNFPGTFKIPKDVAEAFRSLGSQLSYRLKGSCCYCLVGRKGSPPGSVDELLSFDCPISLCCVEPFCHPDPKYIISPEPVPKQRVVRALLVGIQYQDENYTHVNDTILNHGLALVHCGYVDKDSIKILLHDKDTDPTLGPSKKNLLYHIQNWLLKDLKAGDTIYFAYAGHCFRVDPFIQDIETDYHYNFICTLDDELRYIQPISSMEFQSLFSEVPNGVNISMLFDCSFAKGIIEDGLNKCSYPLNRQSISFFSEDVNTLKSLPKDYQFLQNFNKILAEQTRIELIERGISKTKKMTYRQILSKLKIADMNEHHHPILLNQSNKSNDLHFLSSI